MIWTKGLLIIIVGAMPATFLLWFALIPLVAAVAVFGEHPASASLTIIWFLLATIGTIGLWLAPFQAIGQKLFLGLIAGLLAICPFAVFLTRDLVEGDSDTGSVMAFLTLGPTAVAIILLISFLRRTPTAESSSSGR